MRLQSFHHLAVAVEDVERCAVFYERILGLPTLARHHTPEGVLRSIWVGLPDGSFLALEKASSKTPPRPFGEKPSGHHLVAFRIRREDREKVKAELAEKGVAIEGESRWTLYVRDPEGNRIGLSHHPHDPH